MVDPAEIAREHGVGLSCGWIQNSRRLTACDLRQRSGAARQALQAKDQETLKLDLAITTLDFTGIRRRHARKSSEALQTGPSALVIARPCRPTHALAHHAMANSSAIVRLTPRPFDARLFGEAPEIVTVRIQHGGFQKDRMNRRWHAVGGTVINRQ